MQNEPFNFRKSLNKTLTSHGIEDCLSRQLRIEPDSRLVFYIDFFVWLPMIALGILGHSSLLVAISERFTIYIPPHYLILVTSFSVNGILYLCTVLPVAYYRMLIANSYFSTYVLCSKLLADLFLYDQILLVSLLGYQKIISISGCHNCRFLIYKKHAVDIVAIVVFVSLILVCIEIYDLSFDIVCNHKGDYFTAISFNVTEVHIKVISHGIFLFILPLLLMFVHTIGIIVLRYKHNIAALGISTLMTKKVFIVNDRMRDNVNMVLYVMLIILIFPVLFFKFILQYPVGDYKFSHWIITNNFLAVAFNCVAVIPFFVFITPLRVSLASKVSKIVKETMINQEVSERSDDTKNDTLLSIGSIEHSKHEIFSKEDNYSINDDDKDDNKETEEVKFKIGQ